MAINTNSTGGRRFGVEFEIGFATDRDFIRFIIDNLHAIEKYRDYGFIENDELNAEDPSRLNRLNGLYNYVASYGKDKKALVASGKHEDSYEDYFVDYRIFYDNFIVRFYNENPFPSGGEFEQGYDNLIRSILDFRGYRRWEIHNDSSIQGVEHPVEIVTPPMSYDSASFNQITRFCSWIQKYAVTNESMGLHCHVEAKDFTNGNSNKGANGKFLERIALALFHYRSLETVFDNLVMNHRRLNNANRYSKPIDAVEQILANYRELVETREDDLEQAINTMQDERYYKLNLHSLEKHGTLEFRQMHGTLNPTLVKNWIMVCVNFVNMIISTEDMFLQMFQELNDAIDTEDEKLASGSTPEYAKIQEEEHRKIEDMLNQHDYYTNYVVRNFLEPISQSIRKIVSWAFLNNNKNDIISNGKYPDKDALDYAIRRNTYVWDNPSIISYVPMSKNFVGKMHTWNIDVNQLFEALLPNFGIEFNKSSHSYLEDLDYAKSTFYLNFKSFLLGRFANNPTFAGNSDIYYNDELGKISIRLSEEILNQLFNRKGFIQTYMPGYKPYVGGKELAYKNTATKMNQTQAKMAKQMPGVARSRQMAQAARQTAKRPLAEDYLEETDI